MAACAAAGGGVATGSTGERLTGSGVVRWGTASPRSART